MYFLNQRTGKYLFMFTRGGVVVGGVKVGGVVVGGVKVAVVNRVKGGI